MSAKSKRTYPVNKNDYYTAEIEDLTHEGLGVAKINNYPLFIEGALPGETVEFKVIKTGKSFGYGRLMEIKETSPQRVEITDKAYTQTGTMPLQHMTYEAQLQFKKNQVENNLQRIAKLPDVPVYDTVGMEHPYGYRNKAQVPVKEINGELTTGFYRKRSHDLIPIENFLIQDPKIDEAIVTVRDILRTYNLKAYDEEAHKGDIRHLVIRRGYYTGELMIVLVTRTPGVPHKEEIVEDILEQLPETVSIIQNINPKRTNVILGKESVVLHGEDKYRDHLLGYTFEISHQSFYQINPTQTEKLYQIALDYADLNGKETVIDAYCGIGTITLALAKKAKHVHGIEIVAPAIENAERNAELNSMENVSFEVGAAEEMMVQWAQEGKAADVVVVDPPRKGLDASFIDAVLKMRPERMVYVSCNPATLARDLKLLSEGGYDVQKSQPVDMFPQTTHIETVTKLVRRTTQ